MSSFTCHLPPALCKGKKRRIPALPSTARANAVPCSLKDKLKVHLERGGLKRQVSQITFCMSKKVFTIAILCWRGDNFLSQIVLFQSSSPSSEASTCSSRFQEYCSPKTTVTSKLTYRIIQKHHLHLPQLKIQPVLERNEAAVYT